METIQGIFDGFHEYMQNVTIMEENKTVHISYIPSPYDLIDEDLDFDEIHYSSMMSKFDDLLESEILNQIKEGKGLKYVIKKGRMIFRGYTVVDAIIEYEAGQQQATQAFPNKALLIKSMRTFIEV